MAERQRKPVDRTVKCDLCGQMFTPQGIRGHKAMHSSTPTSSPARDQERPKGRGSRVRAPASTSTEAPARRYRGVFED